MAKELQKTNGLDEEDVKKLRRLLTLDYRMPFFNDRGRKISTIAVFIITALVYISVIWHIVIKYYGTLILDIFLIIMCTSCVIWYLAVGKKAYEKASKYIDTIFERSKDIQLTDEAIIGGQTYRLSDITDIIIYEKFYFFISKENALIIVKVNDEDKNHTDSILSKYKNIRVVEKNKPFNIYKYIKNIRHE